MISDAGTPGISDPGAVLINECLKQNIDVIPLLGPSAVTAVCVQVVLKKSAFILWFFPEKKINYR